MNSKRHLRRCHVCGTVNEAKDQLVTKCQSCDKHLAPFYYFDESMALGLKSQHSFEENYYKTTALPLKAYPPIFGITVYWEEDEADIKGRKAA